MDGGRAPADVRIRLLPVALLLILAATAIPVDVRTPALRLVAWSVYPEDVALNVLLFVPLGAAFAGRRWYAVLAVSALLSVAVEILQLAQVGRHAGPVDVVANAAGGLLGSWCTRLRTRFLRFEPGSVSVNRSVLIAVVLTVGSALLVAIGLPGDRHDFSNWDSGYQLAISDELTRDRSWRGTLTAFAVYDHALERGVIRQLAGLSAPKGGKGRLDDPLAGSVAAWKNPEPGGPGFLVMNRAAATEVYERLVQSGAMSLLAWIRVNDVEQVDVERILTFSRDPFHRNFTLGQEGARVAFRLRTPGTGLNAIRPETRTVPVLEPGERYFVAATYDGSVSRVFVDGEFLGRESLAARAEAFPDLHDGSLPLVLAACGGCAAGLFVVVFRRPLGPGGRLALGCVGGLVVAALVSALGEAPVWPVRPVGLLWRLVPPLTGGLVVALSLAEGDSSTPSPGTTTFATDARN